MVLGKNNLRLTARGMLLADKITTDLMT